jgi:hypothetical protein
MPDLFAEFQTEIKNACNTNFNMVFKLISAVDMYFHSVLLLKFFDKHTHITKHKSVDTILKKIIVITRHYLESGIRSLARDPNWVCHEWPNLDIIKRCFTDYLVDVSDKKKIDAMNVVDFFNYNNPLMYCNDSTNAPPRFRDIKYAKKEWGEPGYKDIKDFVANKPNIKEREAYLKSVDEYVATIKAYIQK